MIQLTPQMRILLAVEPIDLRKGIDGLCQVCRQALNADPFGGAVFVFKNRRGTTIKLLFYDGQGFWVCQKRLSLGRFRYWPMATGELKRALAVHELQLLLWGGDFQRAQAAPVWRQVPIAR